MLARRQALGRGLSAATWDWKVGHHWQLILSGVAAAHRGPVSWEQRAQAAVLHGGDGAALSGDAVVHLVAGAAQSGRGQLRRDPPAAIDVALPSGRQLATCGFFRPHRVSRIEQWRHPGRRPSQLRLAPSVLHSVAWAPTDRSAEWRLAAPVQKRLLRTGDLYDALRQMPRLRRRALTTAVLADITLGAHAQTELDLLSFLRSHSLPLPDALQLRARTPKLRYLDAWWARQRLAVEVDGAHHRDVGSWENDLLRSNDLVVSQRERILLLRYTGGHFRHDREVVARQLSTVLLG